jgi:hypothetical protein
MKLKTIAAAVALAAAAVPAMAAISNSTTGNGELVVVVLDRTDGASYLLDLGLSMDPGVAGATAFDGNGNYNVTLSGANFDAFLTAAAATNNTLEFAVFAGDTIGTNAANPKRLFSTVNATTTDLANSGVNGATANMSTFLNYQFDATGQTHSTLDNGDGWATAGNNAYFLQSLAGDDKFNIPTLTWLNTNDVGTNAAFRSFSTSSTSAGAASNKTDFVGTWSLQNNGGVYTLAYASTPAIPEADGIVLLMAGLGAIAFVGRRRRDH